MTSNPQTTTGSEATVDISFKQANGEFDRLEKLTKDLLRVPKDAIRNGGSSTSR